MRHKDALVLLLGTAFVMSGLSIFGAYQYLNADMQQQIQKNIEDSIIYVEHTVDVSDSSESEFVSTLIDDEDLMIETATEDQVIEEVKTYTNVIEIEQLDIKAYINEGSDKAALAGGVGHHTTTVPVGDIGNCVICGHASAVYNCVFNRLNEIQLWDTFNAYDADGDKHTYYVVEIKVVEPTDIGILSNISDGYSTCTLYTCTENGTKRLVVIGKELSEEQIEDYKLSLKSQQISNMIKLNESIGVENISYEFAIRSLPNTKLYYDLVFIGTDKERYEIREGLASYMLGENPFHKEHIYDIDYSINTGITLESGGNDNDI